MCRVVPQLLLLSAMTPAAAGGALDPREGPLAAVMAEFKAGRAEMLGMLWSAAAPRQQGIEGWDRLAAEVQERESQERLLS